jgi:hypothetical protein
MTQLSATASAVLNAVFTNSMPAGDYPVPSSAGIYYTLSDNVKPLAANAGAPIADGVFSSNVQTSGYVQEVTTTGLPTTFTTTGYVFPQSNGTIWSGDQIPINPFPQPQPPWSFPIPVKPDFDQLEEGEHDIPGGKIIIKKIKVTDQQIEQALDEVMGDKASPEEKSKIRKEIEDYAASEEREV